MGVADSVGSGVFSLAKGLNEATEKHGGLTLGEACCSAEGNADFGKCECKEYATDPLTAWPQDAAAL